MDLALRFSTRRATAYRRGGDRTRRLFNAAVRDEVHVRDGPPGVSMWEGFRFTDLEVLP